MDYPKFETKETKKLKIKDHIFNVALGLMKENGYDNLTIRKICEISKVSIGMFYRHFSSKEDLLFFYYEKAEKSFDEYIKRTLVDMPLEEQIIGFYSWLCQFTEELGMDFCQNFFNSKNKAMNTDSFDTKLLHITDTLIENACQKGYILSKGRTPQNVSKDLCVLAKGVIFDWCVHDGNYNLCDYTTELMHRCLKSLL